MNKNTTTRSRFSHPTAPAIHTARMILKHFELTPKTGKIPLSEKNLAIIVDVCTQMPRIAPAIRTVLANPWPNRNELVNNAESLQDSLRGLELVHNRLPSYGESQILGPNGLKVK